MKSIKNLDSSLF